MNLDRPIYWHQGQLLQPHHFQHGDMQASRHAAQLAELAAPYPWGVSAFELDERALASGTFSISRLTARFRDGAFVEYPGNAWLQPRRFKSAEFGARARRMYVGIRALRPGEMNCTVCDDQDAAAVATTRFATLADPEASPDYLSGEAPADMQAMSYVVKLLWDDELEQATHFETLPIAQLELDGDAVRVGATFCPPVLHLGASALLRRIVRDVRDDLLGRAHQLSSAKAALGMANREPELTHWRGFLALTVLNRYGPLLCHYLDTAHVHPWYVWGTLRQLIGELSAFCAQTDMLTMGPDGAAQVGAYHHDEVGAQFSIAAGTITQMLNEITLGPDQVVPLRRVDEFWAGEFPDGFFGSHNRYYLGISSAQDGFDSARLHTSVKLGSPTQLPGIVAHALSGVELIALSTPPAGIPRRAGTEYFRVDTLDDAWCAVMHERGVALFYEGENADGVEDESLSFELLMVRR
ncbi:type VI secretion system-associated protein [Pandoraea iniqua]|uniref:Type VI secretion system-associated protein n=1 Tax=Pandoraea iniqua TaxID=2508288 RepID=A0A5E4YEI5_9BURK|nr:type VI secretion system baseplate subunit TssK [Pandoraea iniqua]VVE46808.1 type VI secretion system-associated protein [Pandoraea iniqua]